MRRILTGLVCLWPLLAQGAPCPDGKSGCEVERRTEGKLVLEDIPPIPERIITGLRRYQSTRSARFLGWRADTGGMIITTRFGNTDQLHSVSAPGSMRRQLTFFDEPIRFASVSPDARNPALVFARDVGGSEDFQLFRLNLTNGTNQPLTSKGRNGEPVIAADGRVAYYSTARNGRDWDIMVTDTEGRARRILSRGGTWFPIEWSEAGDRLLVARYISASNSLLYVLSPEDGSLAPVAPASRNVSFGDARWARDGAGIYYSNDDGSDFRQLRYYNLTTGEARILTPDIPWDIDTLDVAPDGRELAFVTNVNGSGHVYLMNTRNDRYQQLTGVPNGHIDDLTYDPEGARIAMTVNGPKIPGDVFVWDKRARSIQRWTDSETAGLDARRFTKPREISFPTFDSVGGVPRRIPALYFRPERPGPHPVVIELHGGPESQYRPRFSARRQYLIDSLGVAVIGPNVRGSEGYGKAYLALDNGKLRENSVADVGALIDWIAEQPELDAGRVAVFGGSYGGYMVLSSLMHHGERLACGVDVVGISNFVTFLENTRDYRRDLRRVEYGDERDPDMRTFLLDISPARNADRITRPLFVVQGLNDPRVPSSESEQMVAAIRANGQSVWYLLAKNEGHGFRRKTNRDYFNAATVLFLERCLAKTSDNNGTASQ